MQDKLVGPRLRARAGGWFSGGTWILNFTYSPYGTAIDSAGTQHSLLRYRWTGREYDAETGWYFHRSRYYDPQERRFVQEDPIGYGGGGNPYAYVSGQVLEARDPSGLIMVRYRREPDDGRGGGGAGGADGWDEFDRAMAVFSPQRRGDGFWDTNGHTPCGVYGTNGGCESFGDPNSYRAPYRSLSQQEMDRYHELCESANCPAVRVYTGGGTRDFVLKLSHGRTVTLGHNIYLSDSPSEDEIAHELTHVVQFEKWGGFRYTVRGISEQWLGKGPGYSIPADLGPNTDFWGLGMEQQGQLVQECFISNSRTSQACSASPFRP